MSGPRTLTLARVYWPAYLVGLHVRCRLAFYAEMEAEPYSAERLRLARRTARLSRLRTAVQARVWGAA